MNLKCTDCGKGYRHIQKCRTCFEYSLHTPQRDLMHAVQDVLQMADSESDGSWLVPGVAMDALEAAFKQFKETR